MGYILPKNEASIEASAVQIVDLNTNLVGRTGHYLNSQIDLAGGVLILVKAYRDQLEHTPWIGRMTWRSAQCVAQRIVHPLWMKTGFRGR